MKRVFLCLAVVLWGGICSFAQNAVSAERQAAEERVQRLSADMEVLIASNARLQKRLSEMAEELGRMREEQAKAQRNTSVQDDVRRLADKIQEVDKKRAADRELILDQIEKLGKLIASGGGSRGSTPTPSKPDVSSPSSSRPEKGFEHVVQSGNTLSTIVAAYNEELKEKGMKTVTMKQVMDANPNVNWNRLRIGQKIFIPMDE